MMREETKRYDARQLSLMSHDICRQLLDDERVGQAAVVYAFWPMPSEPDIRPLIHELYAQCKTIFLPRVISKTQMEFRRYEGDESLAPVPPYGIMEPISGRHPSVDDSERAVMLVPGVAFDKDGHRLGHGCGYYDRYLAAHPMPTVAVCFPFQMVACVPTDEYDINIQTLKE